MSVPCAVVGTGPAGLGAVEILCERGVRVTLLDEGHDLGGQGWHPQRSVPEFEPRRSASREQGARVIGRVTSLGDRLELRPGCAAVALYPGPELVVHGAEGVQSLRPRALLLATGAYDRVLPFPGWTLPGVLGLGGLLNLLERHGLQPSGPVVLAGAGPLLLLAAVRLVELGHPPAEVYDCAGLASMLPALPGLLGARGLLSEGRELLARLSSAGVGVRRRWAAVEARGEGRIEAVRVAPVDSAWRPDPSRARWIEASLLAVGHGLVPELALAAGAGVALGWDNPAGGWVPRVHADMSTGIEGLWLAGDGCGVHGAEVAWLQGRRAGLAMAVALGAERDDDPALAQRIEADIAAQLRARRGLERALQPRAGLLEALPDATLVCRCEEVPLGELRAWMGRGAADAATLKMATRAGMGRCQGRFCAGSLRMLLAGVSGARLDEPLAPRPPARPVLLGDIASWVR